MDQHLEDETNQAGSACVLDDMDDVTPSTSQSTLEDAERRCILHTDIQPPKKSRIQVVSFTDASWNAVQKAASSRKQKRHFHSSKFYGVIQTLPDKPSSADGYHSICYKNFTAVTSEHVTPKGIEKEEPTKKHLRAASEPPPVNASTAGIFPRQCLFCNQVRKRKKGGGEEELGACETKDAAGNIQEAARVLKDDKILAKISGVDMIAKEVKYHHSCRSEYLKKAQRCIDRATVKEVDTIGSSLDAIHSYIEKSVIVNKRSELLTSLYARYQDMCSDTGEKTMHSAQALLRNVTKHFGSRLKVHSPVDKKSGVIIYNSNMAHDAVRTAYDYVATPERTITQTALLLRKLVQEAEKTSFSSDGATFDQVKEGDASPPELLLTFFNILYGGPNEKRHTARTQRWAESSSQDALFAIRKGHVKPKKHIALGMAVKGMTGSKKLVSILNRFGHCLNYNCLEEMETSIASAIQEREVACPEGTVQDLPFGVAFDNFDEFTETLSGCDTLHDTMGILYQSVDEANTKEPVAVPTVPARGKGPRKRSLKAQDQQLPPYRGRPKMTSFDYRNTEVFNQPDICKHGKHMDFAWLMAHALDVENVPMWIGFMSKYYVDKLPQQVVRYLPNMRQPITGLDVIQETLDFTQRCAQECRQTYGVVTYDLAAAKPAMQMQVTEKPKYDNLFIMPGVFHVEMAFFKALGKLIEDAGGPAMLTEADVLATGSLNGFLSGKHFNRCKRLHPILGLALEILHFQAFIVSYDEEDELKAMTDKLGQCSPDDLEALMASEVFIRCVSAYKTYTEKTRSGEHGVTAQFWMMYIDYIHHYHTLERAIRTNDINLYIYSVTPIIDLFFVTNHVNYARWLSKFQLDLLNMDDTHPGLRDILEDGVFSVRRTPHQFSRSPVDLTLEQTVNADAASRQTGLVSATNNYCARLRWMLTKSSRAAFIGLVQEMTGLTTKEDVTAELQPSRIRRDRDDLKKVMEHIKKSRNPFQGKDRAPNILVNLHTGKAASQPVRDCLLNVPGKGRELHKNFITECQEDPSRFEKPIRKQKLLTFKDEGAKGRKKSVDRKIAELKCTRDLMGRLVVLAMKKNLDLEHVMSYPLTTVPLSLCSTDGMMTKTDKSVLLKVLEEKVEKHMSPLVVDACIIDGNFLLHTLPATKLPATFGGVARSFLVQSVSLSPKRVDIAFDDYPTPSVKDCERARRGTDDSQVFVLGPEQIRPKNFDSALNSRSFKQQFPLFIAEEWKDQSYAHIIGTRDVYLGFRGYCYHFYVLDGQVIRESVEHMATNHEEADSLVCFHARCMETNGETGNIVVRASDTDIAVILLYHSPTFTATLWMDTGTNAKNTRRYINLTAIGKVLGPLLCKSLPAFHAFTGCDYTSAFVKKGKKRPFAKLEKSKDMQRVFASLVSEREVTATNHKSLQAFTASLYGAKQKESEMPLNKYRYKVFQKAYGPKATTKNPLDKLKGLDASGLPPCESELMAHVNRSAFVATMWANADQKEIEQHPKQHDGWELEGDTYNIVWFEGQQVPDTLVPKEGDTASIAGDPEDDFIPDHEDDFVLSSDDETGDLGSDEEIVED